MRRTIDETDRRREKQIRHNTANGIVPTTITKSIEDIMQQGSVLEIKGYNENSPYAVPDGATLPMAAEPAVTYRTIAQVEKLLTQTKKAMEKAAKDLDFMEAARLRDELFALQKEKEAMK